MPLNDSASIGSNTSGNQQQQHGVNTSQPLSISITQNDSILMDPLLSSSSSSHAAVHDFNNSTERINSSTVDLLQPSNSLAKLNDSVELQVQQQQQQQQHYQQNEQSRKLVKEKSSKKPWYSAFTFTYKQKNEDFKRLFKDLPVDERLLVDYACALQKEILAQGRLYISLNHVCFYANILGWETNLSIRLKDIRSIVKDKTVKVIPNAITIVTDTDKHFFTSFGSRDKTYTTLYKMWNSSKLEQSMGHDEVTNILRSFYGEDLGYNSDDDEYEYYAKAKAAINGNARMLNNFDTVSYKGAVDQQQQQQQSYLNSDTSMQSIANFQIGGSENSSLDQSSSTVNTNSTKNSPTNNNDTGNKVSEFKKKLSAITKLKSNSQNDLIILNNEQIHDSNNNNTDTLKSTSVGCSATNADKAVLVSTNSTNMRQSKNSKQKLHKTDIDSYSSIDSSVEQPPPQKQSSSKRANSKVNIDSAGNTGTIKHNSNKNVVDNHSETDTSTSDSDELNDLPIDCNCKVIEHAGRQMLNKVYNLSVNYLFELMFGHSEFCKKFWESRKFFDMKIGEWQNVNGVRTRRLEYNVVLNSSIGVKQCKNAEEQKLIKYVPNKLIIMESYSRSFGVPYADTFAIHCRYCITKTTETKSTFKVHANIRYPNKPPMFVAKAFIEKNAMSALNDAYQYLAELVTKEFINTGTLCHNVKRASLLFKNENNSGNESSSSCCSSTNNNNKSLKKSEKHIQEEIEDTIDSIPDISAVCNDNDDINNNQTTSKTRKKHKHRHRLSSGGVEDVNASASNTASGGGGGHKKHSLRRRQNSVTDNNFDTSTVKSSMSATAQQPNLIPIQSFSFLKWSINVDTLVRLFIIAMLCLMIINGMLYYKLRRIEILADGIKNDPQIISKYQKLLTDHNQQNRNSKDINEFRQVISYMLKAIEKVGYPIHEHLDKSKAPNTELDFNDNKNEF